MPSPKRCCKTIQKCSQKIRTNAKRQTEGEEAQLQKGWSSKSPPLKRSCSQCLAFRESGPHRYVVKIHLSICCRSLTCCSGLSMLYWCTCSAVHCTKSVMVVDKYHTFGTSHYQSFHWETLEEVQVSNYWGSIWIFPCSGSFISLPFGWNMVTINSSVIIIPSNLMPFKRPANIYL